MKKLNNLYDIFLGHLIKKGKKVAAKKILDNAFLEVYKKTKLPLPLIFKKLLLKIGNLIELKRIKVRKNTYLVPFSVKSSRRNYVMIKNIVTTIEDDKSRTPFYARLGKEISNIVLNKPNHTVTKNKESLRNSAYNRSNIHYRW